MCKYLTNKQITVILNMIFSIIIAMFIGIILRILGLPCWLICGSVATIAVIAEHFLTLYPLFILKYINLIKTDEGKKNAKN